MEKTPWSWYILLSETIILLLLWLWSDYIGSLITIIFLPIIWGILLVAIISEWLEKSKVPKAYFTTMLIAGCIPIIIALVMKLSYGSIIW